MAIVSMLCFGASNCGSYRSAWNLADIIRSCGHEVITYPAEGLIKRIHTGFEQGDLSILTLPPLLMSEAHEYAGIDFNPKVKHVGYWYWETNLVPPIWQDCCKQFQLSELWCPTSFIKEAVDKRGMPCPTHKLLPYTMPPKFIHKPNLSFEIDHSRFIFMYSFDFASVFQRKNPIAVIEAANKAFNRDDKVQIVFKTIRSFIDPGKMQELVQEAQNCVVPVDIIDRAMPLSEYYGLINECDCYVSPHCSEGFGLTLIEAAYMGKPVIATGYSGNMDFMAEYQLLIPYKLVDVPKEITVYGGCGQWANPDIDALACYMRLCYTDQELAKQIGDELKQHMYKRFDKDIAVVDTKIALKRNGIE